MSLSVTPSSVATALFAGVATYVLWKALQLIYTDCDLTTLNSPLRKKYFHNKVVWITGASSGIGRQLAIAIAQLNVGAKIILSARREQELSDLSSLLKTEYDCESAVVLFDLRKTGAMSDHAAVDNGYFEDKVNHALGIFGKVDILVNNAGVSTRALAENSPFDLDCKIMNIDFFSYVKLTKLLLPHFISHASSSSTPKHIVNISSLAGKIGGPLRSAYSAAKFAILGHFNAVRLELHGSGYNIYVTNVCPGSVATDVDKNAFLASGMKYKKRDQNIQNGMKTERCAELILKAISNPKSGFASSGVYESWFFGNTMEKALFYLAQYMPNLFNLLISRMASKYVTDGKKQLDMVE